MAFRLFKKVETCDLVLHHGHIFTQDHQYPWANAVACRGDRIVAVGDFESMESYIDDHTTIIDLEDKFVFPGFIDIHRSPVLKVFEGKYADLSDCTSIEEVQQAIADWAEENQDEEVIFGYGYSDFLKPESDDEEGSISAAVLDQACADRPVLLLCQNGIDCWTNTAADQIVVETAEEEVVENITVQYVLNLLLPFDFEEIEQSVRVEMDALADKGFTTVLNLGSPDYFENLYQDSLIGLFNEGELWQRFFGSYLLNRPLHPKGIVHRLMTRKTNCIELGDMIHAQTLYLHLENTKNPVPFTQESLNQIMLEIADKGFSFFVEAVEKEDLVMAYYALEYIRSKGYKNTFCIASDEDPSPEDIQDLLYWESAFTTWHSSPLNDFCFDTTNFTSAEVIEHLTIYSSQILNMENNLGSIEVGKLADFAIFDVNLLEVPATRILGYHASMTILGGRVVYDAQQAADMELYQLMSSQQI